MPINLRAASMALVLSGIVSFPVLAVEQTDKPADFLLRGAKMWVDKDRADIARKLLKKLILLQPNSPEALLMLGKIAIKEGKQDEAKRYLHTLKKTAPDDSHTRELDDAIYGKKSSDTTPKVETVQKNSDTPPETAQAKPAARKLAEKTQTKHSKRLKQEAKPAEAAPQADETQADENAISLAEDPDIIARTDALDALADGKVEEAETALLDIIKRRPQDPEVIGGLGLVHQKRGEFIESEQWFRQALQAAQAAKKETGRWESLINTARFSQTMSNAKALLDDNKLPEAEAAVEQALVLKPGDPDALAVKGNIRAADNNFVEAERLYHEALDIEGYNVFASKGLASLLARTGRSAEAIEFIERILKDYQDEWKKNPGSQASLLREEANLYIEAKRPSYAMKALEKALVVDPTNAWVRFSLAKLYISLNLTPLAKLVLQEGIALSPADPSMLQVRALVMLSLDDYAAGLDSLNRIPEASMTQDMRDTRNRALIKYYFQQADAKFAKGQRKEAIRILSIAQAQAEGSYSATEQVAEGWFRLDQQQLGLAAMRKLPQPVPLETQVHFASLLNRAKKDQELVEFLPELHIPEGNDETNLKYRETVKDIEFAMAGRQYDKLIKAGKKEDAQAFADNVLNANQLSSADYFKFHRRYFSDARLPDDAIMALSQEIEQNPNDLDMRWELAYAYYQNKQNSSAQREVKELLALTKPDDMDMRLRIAKLQQSLGDKSGANQTLEDLVERFPNNTEVTLQAGNISRYQGQYNRAMDYYEQTLARSGKTASAPDSSVKVVEATNPPDLMLNLLPVKASDTTRSTVPAPTSTPESERIYRTALTNDVHAQNSLGTSDAAYAQKAMDSISSTRTAKIETGLDIQRKTATSGLSTYNATEIPLLARFPLGYEAYGTVQIDKVDVDAGTLATADSTSFGTGAPLAPLPQKVSGTSFAAGYENDAIRADIGMVGQGFPVSNIVGGVRHGGNFGRLSYSLNLSRRPYTGSVISYAGATDPVSGTTWGGVTNTGVSLYMSTTLSSALTGNLNASAMASYGLLRGKNVLNNDRLYLHAGIDQDVYSSEDTVLNVGINTTYTSFSKDESYYTLGHGGYYSPQGSLGFALPIELFGRIDQLSYQIRTNISYTTTNTDPSLAFPTPQALAAAIAAGGVQSVHAGGPGKGFGYGFRATAEYRLAPEFALGGRFNMDRSAYYAPNSVLFYLRYMFNPETGPVKMRPDPVTPYSQY